MSRLLSSEVKSRCEKFGFGSKISRSFAVHAENYKPVKSLEKVAVDQVMQKNAAVADKENHGLVKIFNEVTDDHKVAVDVGTNLASRGPARTLTSRDSKQAALKQTAADPMFSTVQQSTRCEEKLPASASSRGLGELNLEVETEIGRLSCGLLPEELREVHSGVFCRR